MHFLRWCRFRKLNALIAVGSVSLVVTIVLIMYSGDLHRDDRERLFAQPAGTGVGGKNDKGSVVKMSQEERSGAEKKVLYHKDTRPPLTVERIAKYCSVPSTIEQGEEGSVSTKEYKLLNVHVVIRHGDRSPIHRLPEVRVDTLSCLTDTTQYSQLPKVTNYVQVMSAAAKRRPKDGLFNRWSLFPSHDMCADGQLTSQGAVQHILNGIHYSQPYVYQHQLFDNVNWVHKVVAHTTEISRTFQSAIAFLYGLLPNFDIEKLNLKRSPHISFCPENVFGQLCMCIGLDNLRGKAARECRLEESYKRAQVKYVPVLSHLSEVLNLKPKQVPLPALLLDGLSSYACHNIPAPCSKNGTCVTAKTLEAIWEVVDHESNCLLRNANNKKYAKAQMHGLLHRIVQEFRVAMENGTNPTFHLYSGHDNTLLPLITALELKDGMWPGYASRIVFELYRQESSREHFIRILQNGKVVTQEAVFCRGLTSKGLCSFKHFLQHVTTYKLHEVCESL